MTRFDWDKFFLSSPFKTIHELSPYLNTERFPSCYAPKKDLFYISSLDLDVSTTDSRELTKLLTILRQDFMVASSSPTNHVKSARLKTDFFEVCKMLSNLDPDNEDYHLPDDLLVKQ